ncbi:hypothetical protein L596_005800 [Steinernema carpocapsae]|uniref:Uncharacterized protein n=1 Tax=Steinernema carpocapsae TaxID=34508 RepID=A0A4U8V1L9_STECR|nr:hypothetical protein L596_005800 [Steinernema carpocapsae]
MSWCDVKASLATIGGQVRMSKKLSLDTTRTDDPNNSEDHLSAYFQAGEESGVAETANPIQSENVWITNKKTFFTTPVGRRLLEEHSYLPTESKVYGHGYKEMAQKIQTQYGIKFSPSAIYRRIVDHRREVLEAASLPSRVNPGVFQQEAIPQTALEKALRKSISEFGEEMKECTMRAMELTMDSLDDMLIEGEPGYGYRDPEEPEKKKKKRN